MISYIYIIFHFRRIAGLNEKKAKAILAWREEHGAFINRDQLREVKGIGLKSYEQCVGFVRIINALRFLSNTSKPSISALSSTSVDSGHEIVTVLDSDEEEKPTVRGKKRKGDGAVEGAKRKKKMKNGKQESCANPLDMTWIHPESYPVAER